MTRTVTREELKVKTIEDFRRLLSKVVQRDVLADHLLDGSLLRQASLLKTMSDKDVARHLLKYRQIPPIYYIQDELDVNNAFDTGCYNLLCFFVERVFFMEPPVIQETSELVQITEVDGRIMSENGEVYIANEYNHYVSVEKLNAGLSRAMHRRALMDEIIENMKAILKRVPS